jgi:hypothetical protein
MDNTLPLNMIFGLQHDVYNYREERGIKSAAEILTIIIQCIEKVPYEGMVDWLRCFSGTSQAFLDCR